MLSKSALEKKKRKGSERKEGEESREMRPCEID